MPCPTVDQASKQNLDVNIQDSEFGKMVVRWREQDTGVEYWMIFVVLFSNVPVKNLLGHLQDLEKVAWFAQHFFLIW